MNKKGSLSNVIDDYVNLCETSGKIDQELYFRYDVKRGLRESNGKGVLTGLTEISDVVGFENKDGERIPIDGRLYFQGYDVFSLVNGFGTSKHGFEETTFLLLFGRLPDSDELQDFMGVIGNLRALPNGFLRDVIMKAPSRNIMNIMQKCVLTLYSYDRDPDNPDVRNNLRQCLGLIARFPVIAAYGYQSYRHEYLDDSLIIHKPKEGLSTAENILRLLRRDSEYTELEAQVLDTCLVIHAEHGGGNNSTFTDHVITSTGTDVYSAIAGSLGSLKGPRHGGANIKVKQMFRDLARNVKDWEDEDAIRRYLKGILSKEGFDHSGLIYGMGHAVYSKSDPRAVILKEQARRLSDASGFDRQFALYDRVEEIAKELITDNRTVKKPVCANVDFYSGLIYEMLRLPEEIYTPLFAIARISGWSAHRMEEIVNKGKIIRPAYMYVGSHKEYVPIEER